jgi:tripeptide aminopeptidase
MKDIVKHLSQQYDLNSLQPAAKWVIEQGVNIQQIPAPTFAEAERAAYVAELFTALDLQDVHTDGLHNVYGVLRGANADAPAVMLMAHTDTVFPEDTPLDVRREGNVIHGPGLGDNSIGVSGMLGVAHVLRQENIQPACDLWFVATVREEGLGNLDGARLAYNTLQEKVGLVINVEGLAYGYVYQAGLAVRRLHIVAQTQGGHSWLHFGRASATHAIVRLGAEITTLYTPQSPRTTYNIGMIEGGHSINSIATDAGMWLDMRSESSAALLELEHTVRAAIQRMTDDETRFQVTLVGDRPAGKIAADHPLVEGALAALAANGVRGVLQIGSTDGNIPLAAGCPAVTVGVTRGGNAHRTDEYIETPPIVEGLRQLVVLTLAAAHQTP